MSDVFADPGERRLLVADVAARRGIAAWVVEKDLWVCWVLARLHEMAGLPELTFKGGTSLSKVYGLVDRFSEDIDLTFSRAGWGYEGERDPLAEGLSGQARQRLVDEIVTRSEALVRNLVVPALRCTAEQQLGQTGWAVESEPDDAAAVRFVIPDPAAHYSYGLPAVKIEFGARGEPWPTERRLVRPYLEEEHPGTAPAARVEVLTLRPERTFWEKVTLLHALHHGTLAKPDKHSDRLSRHLYDLHRLWHTPALRPALLDPVLLDAVARNKTVFFKEGKARYELLAERKLAATPHPALQSRLQADFVAMQSMFFPGSKVPTFDELLATPREIEALVASWERSG
jgi:hypothetical protein